MTETLFNADKYGEATPKRQNIKKDPVVPQPWHEPWKLLAGNRGVIGHHLVKAWTESNSALTLCGKTGHLVGDGRSAQMLTCDECSEVNGL